MKRLLILFVGITMTTGAIFNSSCTFLDIDPYITDLFTLDSVFAKRTTPKDTYTTCMAILLITVL